MEFLGKLYISLFYINIWREKKGYEAKFSVRKIKLLLPSLRERKRYILYKIEGIDFIEKEFLYNMIKQFLGELGMSKAGIIILGNKKSGKGIIRVNNNYVDEVKTALALINNYNNKDIKVESLKVSGVINKVKGSV